MKIFCQKCNSEISNDFDNTLTFCKNCGEKLSFSGAETKIPSNRQSTFKTILLTSFFTSVFLLAIAGIGLYAYFSYNSREKTSNSGGSKDTPTPRKKQLSAVAASEITKVEYSRWSHLGPLVGGDGRVVSNSLSFSKDLTAAKIEETNYDNDDAKDRRVKYDGKIDAAQFEKLAETVADRDFLNLPDSTNRISESDAFLVVSYNGGEKKILTSNMGKDITEIEEILRTMKALELVVAWKEAK